MAIGITYYEVSDWMATGTTNNVTGVAWNDGDLICTAQWVSDQGSGTAISAPTNANLTFTQRQNTTETGAAVDVQIHTAPATLTETAQTITSGRTGTTNANGCGVWVLSGHDGYVGGFVSNAESAQSYNPGAGSIMLGMIGDWSDAISPTTGLTASGTLTEREDTSNASWGAVWVGDWNDVDAGSDSWGIQAADYSGSQVAQAFVEVAVSASFPITPAAIAAPVTIPLPTVTVPTNAPAPGDFVVRRNASDTTILTDTDGGTTDVNWDTAVDNEGTDITYSAGTFTLNGTGRYLVMASDQVGTTDTTANERTTTDLQIRLAGTTLREGAGSGYTRRSGGSQEHIPSVMAYVNVTSTAGTGDELEIRHTRRDNTTAGDFARIADRSGVSILKLDDTWNFAHYRSSAAFTPSATDNTRNQSNIGTTVEQDGTVFARTGNQVTVDTANPVLVMLTHQVDYGDVLSGRSEYQQSLDFDGAEIAHRGWTQVYGPRGSDNANATSMTSATIIYPDDNGQILEANLISREDSDEDFFCELQLIELPSGAETATVERSTAAGDANAAGTNFAWQTSVNVDTAAFTHSAGNANIDVDNADDYIAVANLGTTSDAGWNTGSQRDVPAIGFRVNTTDQNIAGNSTYNRMNGTAEHGHMFIAGLLTGLAANDSVYVRANRLGTTTGTRTATGGFSLVRLSSLFAAGDATVTATAIAAPAAVPAVTVTAVSNATVTATAIAAVAAVPAVTVTAETSATVTATAIAAVASVPAVTVATGSTVAAVAVAAVAAVPAPTVTAESDATVTATAIAAVAAVPAVTVTTSTNATVTPSAIVAVAAIPAVTVDTESNATVTPAAIAAVAAVDTPTVTAASNATVTPSTVSTVVDVPAVTVTAATNATVTPAAIAAVAAVPTPTFSTGSTVTAVTVAAVAAVPAVTVQTSGNVDIAATAVPAVAAVPTPTVTAESNATITATAVAAVAAVPAPTVSTESNATVTAVTVAAVAAVPTPTVQTAGNATVTPASVAAVAAVPAVTVTTESNATVTPVAVAAVAAVPTPTVTTVTDATVTAAAIVAVAAVPAVTVTATSNATVTPVAVAAVAAIPTPTTSSGATITATAVAVVAAVPAVTVSTASNATVAPATVTAIAALPAPALATGSTVTPATVACLVAVGQAVVTGFLLTNGYTVTAVNRRTYTRNVNRRTEVVGIRRRTETES